MELELHFYPGEDLLVLMDDEKVKGRFDAMGGPEHGGNDPAMHEEPTWPGRYIINKAHTYNTTTWRNSRLPWGTPLKDFKANDDVGYLMSNGKWGSLKGLIANPFEQFTRQEVIALNKHYYGIEKVPDKWLFNDFGPIAIRWFKDTNNNKKLDSNEKLSGQMFHTTPDDEANHKLGKPVELVSSHGCIHLKPLDRDKIFELGGFKPGTPFIVHKYKEKFSDDKAE